MDEPMEFVTGEALRAETFRFFERRQGVDGLTGLADYDAEGLIVVSGRLYLYSEAISTDTGILTKRSM